MFDYGEDHYQEEAAGRRRTDLRARPRRAAAPIGRPRKRSFSRLPLRLRGPDVPPLPAGPDVPSFPEELGAETYLVRSTSFEYHEKPIGSFLERVGQSGHKRRRRRPLSHALTAAARPLLHVEPARGSGLRGLQDLETSTPRACQPARVASMARSYRLLDLDGEGISGILTEQDRVVVLQAESRRRTVWRDRGGRACGLSLATLQRRVASSHGSGRRRQSRSRRSLVRPRPAFTNATSKAAWAGFPRVSLAARAGLERPQFALRRPDRRRHRRHPDHRGRRLHLASVAAGRRASAAAVRVAHASRRGSRGRVSFSPTARSRSISPT